MEKRDLLKLKIEKVASTFSTQIHIALGLEDVDLYRRGDIYAYPTYHELEGWDLQSAREAAFKAGELLSTYCEGKELDPVNVLTDHGFNKTEAESLLDYSKSVGSFLRK